MSKFNVGDRVKITKEFLGLFSEFKDKVGVVEIVDPPESDSPWPFEVRFPGESLTAPFAPEELEHVSEG
jgi:hypothetical protein